MSNFLRQRGATAGRKGDRADASVRFPLFKFSTLIRLCRSTLIALGSIEPAAVRAEEPVQGAVEAGNLSCWSTQHFNSTLHHAYFDLGLRS